MQFFIFYTDMIFMKILMLLLLLQLSSDVTKKWILSLSRFSFQDKLHLQRNFKLSTNFVVLKKKNLYKSLNFKLMLTTILIWDKKNVAIHFGKEIKG